VNSFWKQFVCLAVTLVMLIGVSVAEADEKLTKAQEASALKFARQHHSELAELLKKLDQEMASEYEKAIRQIALFNQRLERIRKRSSDDYKIQLSLWKVDSRIKLLGARMTMSSDEKLISEMEKLLTQRLNLREKQLVLDQKRAQVRLDRVQGQITKIRSDRQEYLEKELAKYRRLQTSKTTPTSTQKTKSQ
jgi:flagellar biosynthesis regulator FlaF